MKKEMIKLFVFAIILILHTSCQRKGKTNDFRSSNDLELISGWTRNHPSIVEGNAYSGTHYIHLDEKMLYGPGFKMAIEELGFTKFSKIDLEAMIRVNDPNGEGCVVLSVIRGDSTIYWKSLNSYNERSEPGGWVKVNNTFEIESSNFYGDDFLLIFPWSSKGNSVDFDDIKFSIRF